LTATERRRFIRTYYQLWSLIRQDENQWPSGIASLSIKQVYLVREMCWIPLPVGDDMPTARMEERFPKFAQYGREGRRARLGAALFKAIEAYVERKNSWFCDEDPWLIRPETRSEGYAGFHLLWDHGKPALKQYALGRATGQVVQLPREEAEYERRELWAESSDEEEDI
jgi:hypothetical protein